MKVTSKMKGGGYFKAADIDKERPLVLTIQSAQGVRAFERDTVRLAFEEEPKTLDLNVPSLNAVCKPPPNGLGDETDDWPGACVELSSVAIKFKKDGEEVETDMISVKVMSPRPKDYIPAANVLPLAQTLDDDIPFAPEWR